MLTALFQGLDYSIVMLYSTSTVILCSAHSLNTPAMVYLCCLEEEPCPSCNILGHLVHRCSGVSSCPGSDAGRPRLPCSASWLVRPEPQRQQFFVLCTPKPTESHVFSQTLLPDVIFTGSLSHRCMTCMLMAFRHSMRVSADKRFHPIGMNSRWHAGQVIM